MKMDHCISFLLVATADAAGIRGIRQGSSYAGELLNQIWLSSQSSIPRGETTWTLSLQDDSGQRERELLDTESNSDFPSMTPSDFPSSSPNLMLATPEMVTCNFVVAETSLTWVQHQEEAARNAGCNLASIIHAVEHASVIDLIGTSSISGAQTVWLGGRIMEGGLPGERGAANWEWLDGSEWEYENFWPTEPNNLGGVETALSLFTMEGQTLWNDEDPTQAHPAVYKCCSSFESSSPVGTTSPSGDSVETPTSSPGLPKLPTQWPVALVDFSNAPSDTPSLVPSVSSSSIPSDVPSVTPSLILMLEAPSDNPSTTPTLVPSMAPSDFPSVAPSFKVATDAPTRTLGLPRTPSMPPSTFNLGLQTTAPVSTFCWFEVMFASRTWAEHNTLANELDCNLASILDETEQEEVVVLVQSTPGLRTAGFIYLGGMLRSNGTATEQGYDHWEWSDKNRWAFETWHTDQPNNGDRVAMHLISGQRPWASVSRFNSHSAIYKCCTSEVH